MDRTTNRLTNIQVEEVSLVDKPANDRRFLIVKKEDATVIEMLNKVLGGDLNSLKELINKGNFTDDQLTNLFKGDQKMDEKVIENIKKEYDEKLEKATKELEEKLTDVVSKMEELMGRVDTISKNMATSQTESDASTDQKEQEGVSKSVDNGIIYMERKPL